MSDGEIKIGDDRFDLLSAEVSLSIDGVPTYHVTFGGYDPPVRGTAIQIRLADTGFRATVANATELGGTIDLRAVGGNGALSQALSVAVEGRGYISYPAYLPLQELLAEIGVTATDETVAAAEAFSVERWQRLGGPAASAASTLARAAGLMWRVLGDGRFHMAEETWPAYAADGLNVEEDSATLGNMRMSHNFDLCDLAPGMSVYGRQITAVTFTLDSNAIRIRAGYRTSGPGTVKEALTGAMARSAHPLGYNGVYEARVAKQNGNGTVDVITGLPSVDGPEGVVAVPLRLGLARARQVLQEGQRVRLRFEGSELFPGGDPSKPYCEAIEQDVGADRPIARKGEKVKIGTLSIQNGPPSPPAPAPTLTITYTPEPSPYLPVPGIPVVAAITAPGISITPGFTASLEGWITTGSTEIFLQHSITEETP